MKTFFSWLGLMSISVSCGLVEGADWPGWRGKDGLGISPEQDVPLEWAKDRNVAWLRPLPGRGASSPVIVGDRIYVTTQTEDQGLHVLALAREDGSVAWDVEVGRGRLPSHDLHNMATPTPVSDGRNLWVMFGTGDLACLGSDGSVRWRRNLSKEFGPLKTNHGFGPSPVLEGGRLFVVRMHQGPDSYVMAIDAETGKDVWKKDRSYPAKDEGKDSYSTPILHRWGGRTELVVAGAEALDAYDPATGERLWRLGGLGVPHPYGRTIAGPVASDGVVVAVASGFQNRGYTVAVKAGAKGDVPSDGRLWTSTRFSTDCPTPVVVDGMVFSIRDDGMASCLDLKTGEARWQERLFTDNVKVSPVAAAGRVYFTSGQGNTVVVKASPKLEVLARNQLNEYTVSTPAIAHGRFHVRTEAGLRAIGSRP